jgi:hypothetical protein
MSDPTNILDSMFSDDKASWDMARATLGKWSDSPNKNFDGSSLESGRTRIGDGPALSGSGLSNADREGQKGSRSSDRPAVDSIMQGRVRGTPNAHNVVQRGSTPRPASNSPEPPAGCHPANGADSQTVSAPLDLMEKNFDGSGVESRNAEAPQAGTMEHKRSSGSSAPPAVDHLLECNLCGGDGQNGCCPRCHGLGMESVR